MFYNKEVKLYKLEAMEDEWGGALEEEYVFIKALKVDIQPNSREKLNREYGYDLETTKRMFCTVDPAVSEASVVTYEGKPYDIVKIIEWDDFLDIALLDAVGVDLNG